MGMTKRFWMLLVCLLLACGVALAECVVCGGDSVCDTCDGNGYLFMQAYGSDEQLKVACTGGCNNGRCPDCTPPCDVCGGDQKCDVCGGLGYLIRQAYGSGEDVKVACTGESCADGACAVCGAEKAEDEVIDLSQEYTFKDPLIKKVVAEVLDKNEYSQITYGELLEVKKIHLWTADSPGEIDGVISTLEDLRYMSNLEYVSLQKREISDISPLKDLHALKYLSLSYNKNITDISPLANLHSLEYLGLHNNDVSDLSPIAGLTNLKFLYLNSNEIADLSPLANLVHLESLFLENNDITDLSALAGLTKLQKIDVEGNEITDISVLANMKDLTEINVRSNHIKDLSILDKFPNATRYSSGNEDAYVTPPAPTPKPTNTPKPTFRTGLTMVSDNNGGFKFINVTATPAPTLPEPPTIDLMAILAESQAEREKENTISFEVWLMMDDTLWSYEVETTEPVLLDALLDEKLIGGEYVSWGFNVTRVDDIEAKGNEYWTIEEYNFARGEFESMQDSITTHRVQDGDRYGFRLIR